MTARELLLQQLAHAEGQLLQAIRGLDAEAAETRVNPESRTIREQVVHLAEAAVATLVAFEGGTYEAWGTWVPEDRSWEGTKRAWHEIRAGAIAKLPEDDAGLLAAHGFLLAHDYYHVGQIAAARRVAHPEWDTYSLYSPPETGEGL